MMMVFAIAVVMVGVDRQHLLLRSAEQAGKLGVARHALRFAVTADVAIEADHLVGAGHHQMQIVGDHQHGAVELGGQLADEGVELDLAVDVHPLHRFVQHQQLGLDQQGAGQQHPLHFAAGELLHPVVQQVFRADPA